MAFDESRGSHDLTVAGHRFAVGEDLHFDAPIAQCWGSSATSSLVIWLIPIAATVNPAVFSRLPVEAQNVVPPLTSEPLFKTNDREAMVIAVEIWEETSRRDLATDE